MQPINLTENAIAHIKQMVNQTPQAIGFRLSIKKTGCSGFSYKPEIIESATEQDIHFTVNELNIYLDPNCLNYVKDLLVDYIAEEKYGLKQKRLVFTNPNEKSRCGCGESFTVD